jgi:ADP-ribose pyrophosphatase YjhB (NUDIX family)
MQMYKVFIDNWPIHFVYKSTNLNSVEKSSLVVFNDSIKIDELLNKHQESKKIGEVLNVLLENDEQLLNSIFKEYKKIEAAGGIVLNNNDELLLIERLGCWDLPKGKIEKGESIELAAIREVEEECGISNPVILFPITTTYHTYFMKGKHCFKTTYWFCMKYNGNQVLIPQTEEGITNVCWMKKTELNQVFENTYLSIAEVLNAYLNKK